MKYATLLFLFLTSTVLFGQKYKLKKIETNNTSSFRGLSIVDNKIAWLSGTQSRVGRSIDGGHTWEFMQVEGFDNLDFRSLYAFDDQRAIVSNAGSPAHILLTTDAGKSWKEVYTNTSKDAFFDGIDFWNDKEGMVYGDPIDGKMLVLRTVDGGLSWREVTTSPQLEKGEASFAASGTGIRCTNKNEVMICTGGVVSRLWNSTDKGENWTAIRAPIIQGENTRGIFSFVYNINALIIVGGDFQKETLATNHNFYSLDGGMNWQTPTVPIRAYRECVEPIKKKILIATGPSGSDISYDNGINWKMLSDEKGFHVVRKARKGNLVIVAGGKGQVFLIL